MGRQATSDSALIVLWMALYFPDLPLEVFLSGESSVSQSLVITVNNGGRETVSRCNALASEAGIHAGMLLGAALVLDDSIRVIARDPQREQQALSELANWAWQYSSRIVLDLRALLLEVEHSQRLFGDLRTLLEQISQGFPRLGYRVNWALCPTLMGAELLARTSPGTSCLTIEILQERLSDIPLASLTRDKKVRSLIRDIGLSSIGDCLQLPWPELARRSGPELILLLDRLLGRVPDPRPFWQPPEHFEQRLELLAEISHQSALIFPARRLLISLCGFLRGRAGATQHLDWRLRYREERPDLTFRQGLLTPSRDPEYLLVLFRERIERLELAAPVIEMTLRVTGWSAFDESSIELIEGGQGGSGNTDGYFLERLRARLGEKAVTGLEVFPDHRPERSWRYRNPDKPPRLESAGAGASKPLWLLAEPRPLKSWQGQPVLGGPLILSPLSERVEAGWWDGFDISRDYYLAKRRSGERLWIFQDRRSGAWFLQGLFD